MTAPMRQPETGPPVWRGPLGQLLYVLSRECDAVPDGTWVRRSLRKGATVSVTRIEGRRSVMFSRPAPPQDDRGWAAWSNEVLVFLDWFHMKAWEPTEDLPPGAFEGITAPLWSAYREPAKL
jgi:hypothetical protein